MPRPDLRFMDADRDRHYRAIGHVAVSWTRVEDEIAATVHRLAGLDRKVGVCLTAQIANTARMLDALSSLCEIRSPGMASDKMFKKRLDKILGLAERRNRVVHDVWTFDPFRTTRWQTAVRRKLKIDGIEMPTEDVNKLADEIENALSEFRIFRYHLLNDLKLSPDNPSDSVVRSQTSDS